tara:strand:- start:132 stop:1457 length:1326 start_codon:yes stop_codon:yes gene_type:complete
MNLQVFRKTSFGEVIANAISRVIKNLSVFILMSVPLISLGLRWINSSDSNYLRVDLVEVWSIGFTILSLCFYQLSNPSKTNRMIYRSIVASVFDFLFADLQRSNDIVIGSPEDLFLKEYMPFGKLVVAALVMFWPIVETLVDYGKSRIFTTNSTDNTERVFKKISSLIFCDEISVCISILRPFLLFYKAGIVPLVLVQLLEILFACNLAADIEYNEVENLHDVRKPEEIDDKEEKNTKVHLLNTAFAIIAPISLHLAIASLITFSNVRCLSNKCYWGKIGNKHQPVADIVLFGGGVFKFIMCLLDIKVGDSILWIICALISTLSFIMHSYGPNYTFYGLVLTVIFLDFFCDRVVASTFGDKNAIAKGKDVPRLLMAYLTWHFDCRQYTSKQIVGKRNIFTGTDAFQLIDEMLIWWSITTLITMSIFIIGSVWKNFNKKKLN